MLTDNEILHRIYSGFIGKAVGVRLGAPVEPTIWSYERIRKTYGEVTEYLRDFTNFAADDDTNGPIYFIRAMRDYQLEPTAEQVAKTWLNYAADGHGMYWWGGYGRSTENTAYCNLRAGIPAPQSGSTAQNGAAISEQIGGQIFIDSWGWVNPGNPERAAKMSATAASVAHDGDGLEGARFVAAMIAAAFTASSVAELFVAGNNVIDQKSEYARVVRAVQDFHAENPADWRACRDMLTDDFGYDRYPGVCHIIPNAGVMVLAMLYGAGDMPRTVEIATMCGWDTDCNAGNAGAIIGTYQGVQPGWDKYRVPINDFLIASGVIGSFNIVDIPTFARELAVLAFDLSGRDVPPLWREDTTRRGLRFDFALHGSTHGFRSAGINTLELGWADRETKTGNGALEILVDRFERGHNGRVFWKPFYRKSDFDDERYRPMFSPVIDAGQTVKIDVQLAPMEGDGHLRIVPYVRSAITGEIKEIGGWHQPSSDQWDEISFTVPDMNGEAIDEVGINIEYFGRLKFLGHLYIGNFEVSGAGHLKIDPAVEVEEWEAITRFTWNRGYWKLEKGRITGLTDSDADMWTGHAYARDVAISADLMPQSGQSHVLVARAQGTARFYSAGFGPEGVVIQKEDFGTTVLAKKPFERNFDQSYAIEFHAKGDRLTLKIDGETVLEATDDSFAYGMCGLRIGSAGRMSIGVVEIQEG